MLKALRSLLLVLLAVGGVVVTVQLAADATAEADATVCGVQALDGTYALAGQGNVGGAPVAAVGIVSFDGAGHWTGSHSDVTEGNIDRATIVGTYTVGPDCRGTATFEHRHEQKVGDGWVQYLLETHVLDLAVASQGRRVHWGLVESSGTEPVRSLHPPAQPFLLGFLVYGTFEKS